MDMTTVMNPGSYPATGSAILDEEFEYEDNFDNDDMEITETIPGNFARKRSSSIGRRPLSHVRSPPEIDDEVNESQSDLSYESMQSATSDEHSRTMEFTVPLGQSLRPASQDAAWLALRQVTHSGNEAPELEPTSDDSVQYDEGVGMNLEDAMERLRRARDSLPLSSQPSQSIGQLDDTFTSTEDSFEGDNDEGNKTLNLSRIIDRLSIETDARMSVGYQDSNMDESEVYGNIVQSMPGQSLQADRPTIAQEMESSPIQQMPSVFQPPSTTSATGAATPRSSVFTRPISPSKVKLVSSPSKLSRPKPAFSAAFAPPVTKPSPKKPLARIPAKRPRTTNEDDGDIARPNPPKKQVLADKWMETTAAREEVRSSAQLASKPKQLSPSKKALFQNAGVVVNSLATSAPSNGVKRPSGYFARRKSLAASASQSNLGPTSSPKKDVGDFRRLSVGSGSSIAHLELRNQPSVLDFSSNGEKTEGVNETSSPAPAPVQESPPSQTSEDLVHLPAHQDAKIFEQPVALVPAITSPIKGALDLVSEGIEINAKATQQWRDAVQQGDYIDEDDSVREFLSFCESNC
jgi:kinetochore protein Spc7/SPC105